MRWLILTQISFLLIACNEREPGVEQKEPWSNEAETLFQQEAVLRYELEQQQEEAAKLKAQGIDGAPPTILRK
jgi:hypothetical protein